MTVKCGAIQFDGNKGLSGRRNLRVQCHEQQQHRNTPAVLKLDLLLDMSNSTIVVPEKPPNGEIH